MCVVVVVAVLTVAMIGRRAPLTFLPSQQNSVNSTVLWFTAANGMCSRICWKSPLLPL